MPASQNSIVFGSRPDSRAFSTSDEIDLKPVNDRQGKVINRMLDDFKGRLTTSKYAKLAKLSNDTALRDIRELLARGIAAKNSGGGRSTSDRLAEPDEGSA